VLPTSGDRLSPPRPDSAASRAESSAETFADPFADPFAQPRFDPFAETCVDAYDDSRAGSCAGGRPEPGGGHGGGPVPSARDREPAARAGEGEPQGCLYALSQPPLMLFLCVIGGLLGAGALYDLLMT
jgi:hypothetical protein